MLVKGKPSWFLSALGCLLFMAAPIHAQDLPNRPIRIIVPAAAGGGLDLIARVLAQKGTEILGQTIYVENKPGANWIIGMDYVARAQPDGTTLLLLSASGLSINPHIFKNVPPLENFAAITLPTKGTFVLLVNPSLPVRDIAEFTEYLRSNPGKANHASNSASTMLLSELFQARTATSYVDINYRGGSQSVSDTMANVTQFCFVDLGSAMTYIREGTLRPLAITSASRNELVPEIPTLRESGIDVSVEGGTALVAPAHVPDRAMERLGQVFNKGLASPELRARFQSIGQVALGGNPSSVQSLLRDESERWRKIIKDEHIQIAP